MEFEIGMENNVEGRSLAWALGHPGCFAYGADSEEAMRAVQGALEAYASWIAAHNGGRSWVSLEGMEVRMAESFDVYAIDKAFERADRGYEVNAWFLHDWKPLVGEEIERGLKLLAWTRKELLAAVEAMTEDELNVERPGERWSIAGILNHVGGAEWWYLDRLGLAFDRQDVPSEAPERLEMVRQHLVERLPGLEGVQLVVGVDGEFWSPRKMLRRAVWHERDHTGHILRLRGIPPAPLRKGGLPAPPLGKGTPCHNRIGG